MTASLNPSDDLESLARAAGGGDREAVAALLAVIQPRVLRYCRARIGRHSTYAAADDVAQEVLMAVLAALPAYREEGHGFSAFVSGIAAHKVADFYRKRARDQAIPMADVPDRTDDQAGPEQAALRADQQRRLGRLLGGLTEDEQNILVHRLILGLSSAETADLLSSTPGAVRVAQHRALKKLRNHLAKAA